MKKILFTLVFTCLFFFCTSEVLGDNICNYRIDYPFDDNAILQYNEYGARYIDNQYFRYIITKILGHSTEEYLNFDTQRNKAWVGDFSTIYTISALMDLNSRMIELSMNANTDKSFWWDAEDRDARWDSRAIRASIEGLEGSECPDLITLELDRENYDYDNHQYVEKAIISSYYVNDFPDPIMRDVVKKIWDQSSTIVLFLDDLDMKLKRATVFIYMGYYGRELNRERNDVDPIINKYLEIDGWAEFLDEINQTLDTADNLSNDLFNKIKSSIIEQLLNGTLSFDTIENDIEQLKAFDSVFTAYYDTEKSADGLFVNLKKYLYQYDITVSEWYKKYMSYSKTNYIRALLLVLPMADDEEIKKRIELQKEYDSYEEKYNDCKEKYKDDETQIKENCTQFCYDFHQAEISLYCPLTSNPAGCAQNKLNTCYNANSDEILADMEDKVEESRKDLEELVEKKLVDLYKNQGVNIGDTDFCELLLGKNKENGLYSYIKGVLNVIRIVGPILVVILTVFDAMKVISSFKDDVNKKFWNNLKIRLICVIILILVPTIINFVVKLAISKSCDVEI